jgi:phosphoserine aminotransferase
MPVFSFASAQAPLPPAVIEAFAKDIAGWRNSGQSVLALPFTGIEFSALLAELERNLRTLLNIPEQYRVLFLQGGASAHFALLPMNLAGHSDPAAYVETGHWSRRAMTEARHWCHISVAARGDGVSLPPPDCWRMPADAAYCHYTSNETAGGLQFHATPCIGDVPLVADMSADLLTRPIDVERFGLIYASGQKNFGAAGLTMVIVRDDLLGRARSGTPAPFDYTLQAAQKSKVNTPPTIAIAVAASMLNWIAGEGGIGVMARRNRRKSEMLYAEIDGSGFYRSPLAPSDRSLVSVRFHLPNASLETQFLNEAEENGLLHLKGHPAVGGLRASLYNSVPEEAAAALAAFMADFRSRRG